MRVRRKVMTLLVTASALVGCTPDAAPGPTLAEASEDVQFASVEVLGPHHYLATAVRTETAGVSETSVGAQVSRVEETVEIKWQGWDDFEYRRLVDGDVVSAVRVVGGDAWVRRARGKWARKDDAEPYRVKVRTEFNAWEQALELFRDRVAYGDDGGEVVEGRPARRYRVTLGPAPDLPPGMMKRRAGEGEPEALSGKVWVDEGTAVRLQAEVQGTWRRGDTRRSVELRLTRSAIGQDQGIRRPRP